MDNIVVLIGSFNPVTKAHLEALLTAKTYLNASKAIFVPTPEDYVKGKMIKAKERISFNNKDRVEMLTCICKKYPGFEICDYEMKMNTTYKTYETMKYIKSNNPDSEVYYIMGADKLKDICGWDNIIPFFEEFKFLVYKRSNINIDEIISTRPLLGQYKDRFVYLEALENLGEVSSTRVRSLINNNDLSYKDIVDEDVFLILSNKDYSCFNPVTDYDLIEYYTSRGKTDKAGQIIYNLNKEFLQKLDLSTQLNNSKVVSGVDLQMKEEYNGDVEITRTSILTLLKENKNSLLLVEGNRTIPAGDYSKGKSKSLEEKLCLYTTLSSSLYKFGNNRTKAVKESGFFQSKEYPLDGKMIYAPNVKVIRDTKNSYKEMDNLNEEINCLVIPSLSLGRLDKYNDIEAYSLSEVLNEEGKQELIKRLENGFQFAIGQNYETVVMNVFGSGFYIPFNDCAYCLKQVTDKYKKYFKRIYIYTVKTRILRDLMN